MSDKLQLVVKINRTQVSSKLSVFNLADKLKHVGLRLTHFCKLEPVFAPWGGSLQGSGRVYRFTPDSAADVCAPEAEVLSCSASCAGVWTGSLQV
jgi:hypothetical protein